MDRLTKRKRAKPLGSGWEKRKSQKRATVAHDQKKDTIWNKLPKRKRGQKVHAHSQSPTDQSLGDCAAHSEKVMWTGDNALEKFNKLRQKKNPHMKNKFMNEALEHLDALVTKNKENGGEGIGHANQINPQQSATKGKGRKPLMKKGALKKGA